MFFGEMYWLQLYMYSESSISNDAAGDGARLSATLGAAEVVVDASGAALGVAEAATDGAAVLPVQAASAAAMPVMPLAARKPRRLIRAPPARFRIWSRSRSAMPFLLNARIARA